jgi:hypothetical protein
MSRLGVLAEGSSLAPNTLFARVRERPSRAGSGDPGAQDALVASDSNHENFQLAPSPVERSTSRALSLSPPDQENTKARNILN